MKKKIFLLGLTLLVSCSSQGTSFDNDFYSKVEKIKDLESSEVITLDKIEGSSYDFIFEYEQGHQSDNDQTSHRDNRVNEAGREG